jgi:hypothetical protein
MRVIHKIAVAGVVVATLVGVGMGTAFADPSSPPTLTTNVGVDCPPLFVGSPVENTSGSLTYDYDATNPTYPIACWDSDATGAQPVPIITKESGPGDTSCKLTRPVTADGGITALNANQKDVTVAGGQPAYCIDFVFSDRGPHTGTVDTFVALAHDAIDWSYPVVSGQINPQPASLTLADLKAIYTCQDMNWDQVGGANAPIVPVLPQPGAGERDSFLAALGITANNESCWVDGVAGNGDVIVEDTGLSPGNMDQFDQPSSVDDIFPYGIGDWIAQDLAVTGTGPAGTPGGATVGGHASSVWGHGDLAMGETVNDLTGVAEQPVVTNSYSQPVINPDWELQLNHDLFDVVRNGCPSTGACFPTTPTYEAVGLPAVFSSTGWVCTNETAESDIVSYGFLNLGSNCGALAPGD